MVAENNKSKRLNKLQQSNLTKQNHVSCARHPVALQNMLLLAENFTLKVSTRLAHKVLGISKLKYNMHVISVTHFHKQAINDKIY